MAGGPGSGARAPGVREAQRKAALEAFSQLGTITAACDSVGICRETFYTWRKRDPEFAAEFETAKEIYIERLEKEADRRAMEGVERLKFDKNGTALVDPRTNKVYVERHFSDTLLIFRLKALAPDKYRERQEVKHEHSGEVRFAGRPRSEVIAEHIERMAAALEPQPN